MKKFVYKYRFLIFGIMMIIGICLILYGFNVDVFGIISGTDWIVLLTFITLIYTIIRDSKERNKSVESAIISNDQFEFEKRLYDVLNVYDELISESSTMFFDMNMSGNLLIPIDTIFKFKDMPIKYKLKLGKMENDILYFYREINGEHKYLDELIRSIKDLNKDLINELKIFMDLSLEALKINGNNYNASEKCNKYVEVNNKRTKINNNMYILVRDNKDKIYNNAMLCIKERMKIIREKGI